MTTVNNADAEVSHHIPSQQEIDQLLAEDRKEPEPEPEQQLLQTGDSGQTATNR